MAQSPFFTRRLSSFATDANAPKERLAANQNLIRQSTAFYHPRLDRAPLWQSSRAGLDGGPGVFVQFFTRSLTTRNAGRRDAVVVCPLRILLAAGP
jgi:hypothetical protein